MQPELIEEGAPPPSDRALAAKWAYELIHDPAGFVVLDSETTGLNREVADEACELAVIDPTGAVLLDTRVRPTLPIPAQAAGIHGITDAMVADAPDFAALLPALTSALQGRALVIYNATYDIQILRNMLRAAGIDRGPTDYFETPALHCAMEQYAAFYGEWNEYRGDYRWQKLENACAQQRVGVIDAKAHSALGDCLRTLALIQCMAAAHAATETTA